MVDSRRKGNKWERDAVKILNRQSEGLGIAEEVWGKIPASGSLGTLLEVQSLKSDLLGEYPFLTKLLRADAKVGYGGAAQMTVKREWFEKIAEEAEANIRNVPCILGKFSGSRSDVRYFIAFTFEAWGELMEDVNSLYQENIVLRERIENETGDVSE